MELRILSGADVQKALPMAKAIEAMKEAFIQLTLGQAVLPPRSQIEVDEHEGTVEFMPAYLPVFNSLTVKVISIYPRNSEQGLPTSYALVIAVDPKNGQPLALLDGATLTAIRTGAVSGLATDILARADSKTAAIFGCGIQARTQLEAVCTVRKIQRVWVYDKSFSKAEAFAADMSGRGAVPADVVAAREPGEAVVEADIICTATTSPRPVFAGHQVKPGVHINAIGSYRADMQEIDAETVRRALVVVDSKKYALAEAGDLIIPIEQGVVPLDWIRAELGEVVSGQKPGRTDPGQITLFKSVGLAIQDSAASAQVLRTTAAENLGQLMRI